MRTRREHFNAAERHLERADKIMAVDSHEPRCVEQAAAHASIASAHALLAQQAPKTIPVQLGIDGRRVTEAAAAKA